MVDNVTINDVELDYLAEVVRSYSDIFRLELPELTMGSLRNMPAHMLETMERRILVAKAIQF